ncbi:MAG: ABC transporter ATP-binding protein [Bacteroidetes bacterium]|nr:ABC transporter ATP-binding protein [Bacteroidota bacterium]
MSDHDHAILEVKNLTTVFDTGEGMAMAVDDVSFELRRGETLGIVGESGCGKSVTALSIMRLIQKPGRIAGGEVLFEGRDLLKVSDKQMRMVRGSEIGMVFQEPMTSLNPVFTIGDQLTEGLLYHGNRSWTDAYEIAVDVLTRVGIPDPHDVMTAFPHQLSGGMRQRVLIAMALAAGPSVLIADEPTTAIDVTVQAQVLKLINELKVEFGMSVLFISHDLGVVAETCDRVAIMYASHIVECGSVRDIFYTPHHPYTLGLLSSIPAFHKPKERLTIIPGQVPRPTNYPMGCNFHSRCSYATERCVSHQPELASVDDGHAVSCWNTALVTIPENIARLRR